MPKTFFTGILLTAVIILALPPVPAYAEYFTVESFHSNITVYEDSSFTVTETIDTDFTRQRHGIYRDIPYKYTDDLGKKIVTPLKVISVRNGRGSKRQYKVSREGDYIRIRIGNPERYVKGRQVYEITYKVINAILYHDDHDELFWNVTGNRWKTVVKKVSANVRVVGRGTSKELKGACYTGPYGSRRSECGVVIDSSAPNFANFVMEKDKLIPGEGFTIAFGWDKGIVSEPSWFRKLLLKWNFLENWVFLVPIAAFGFMFTSWYKKGRDPYVAGAVTVMYSPPEEDGKPLSPAEVGTLIDEKLDQRDITASVINLAVNGYIRIEEEGSKGLFTAQDYKLNKLKEPDEQLGDFEQELLKELLPGKSGRLMSSLKNSFYAKIGGLRDTLHKGLKKKRYFSQRPDKVRALYAGIAIFVGSFGAVGSIFLVELLPMMSETKNVIAMIITGVIIFFFGRYMPAKTSRGARAYMKVKGFEEFLSRAEKDRLERMADKNLFEKFLPYAIALDVSDRWADAFEGIYQEQPKWYVSTYGHGRFHPGSFNRSICGAVSSMGSAMASAPRSSGGVGGGGFSGGGFGGGGGGSW